MNPEEIEILVRNGWEIECESPFEIRHVDGSFAKGQAAYYVLEGIRADEEENDEFSRRLIYIDVGKLTPKEAEIVINHYRRMANEVSEIFPKSRKNEFSN